MPRSSVTPADSRLLHAHDGVIHGVAWTDDRWISAGHDGCLAWGTLAGDTVTRRDLGGLRPAEVAVTPDYVLVPTTYGPVLVLDRALGAVLGALDHWSACWRATCLGPRLFTASSQGSVREWPAAGPFSPPLARPLEDLGNIVRTSGDGEIWQVELKKSLNAFAVEPERVWCAFSDGVRVWSLAGTTPAKRPALLSRRGTFYSLALVLDLVVAGTAGRELPALVLWDRRTQLLLGEIALDHYPHRLRTATAHGRPWLLGCGDHEAWVRDPTRLDAPVVTVRWPGQFLEDCALTPTGNLIVACGNELRVWDRVV